MTLIKLNTKSFGTGAITAAELPVGTSLQTVNTHANASTVVSATNAHKWMEVPLITKRANSDFDVSIVCSWCAPDQNNRDNQNRGIDFGYKTGSASSTVGDYTAIGGRGGTGAADYMATGMGPIGGTAGTYPIWNTDVIYGQGRNSSGSSGTWGSDYESAIITQKFKIDLSQAAGTTIYFAVWCDLDAESTLNGCRYDHEGVDYSGTTSSLTITEIAT